MRHVNETYGYGVQPFAPVPLPRAETDLLRQELGQFFRNLRAAVGHPAHYISAFLLTEVRTIEALETASVERLPEWPETERVVIEYAALAGLNPAPVVSALQQLIASRNDPDPGHYGPAVEANGDLSWIGDFEANDGLPNVAARSDLAAPALAMKARPRRRVIYAASLPLLLLVVAMNASMLQAAVTQLRPGVMRIVDKGWDYVVVRMAPERAGFRWIEVDDPRSRRGDKLRTTRR